MFGDIGRGTHKFSAERAPLKQTQRYEQDWRERACRLKGRQKADCKCRSAHHDDGNQERIFAARQIADTAENNSTEGPHEEASCAGREMRKKCGGALPGGKKRDAKSDAGAA